MQETISVRRAIFIALLPTAIKLFIWSLMRALIRRKLSGRIY